MKRVVLVDQEDKEIGQLEKKEAHFGAGRLHRAFSVFIFNNQGELLIQKRAASKMLWPGYWSNTCCSHPGPGEEVIEAGRRRLQEELNFSCPLEKFGSFVYSARFKDIGSENEFCHVLVGRYDGTVNPDPTEIEEIKWMALSEIMEEVEKKPEQWTPWFKMEIKKFFSDDNNELRGVFKNDESS